MSQTYSNQVSNMSRNNSNKYHRNFKHVSTNSNQFRRISNQFEHASNNQQYLNKFQHRLQTCHNTLNKQVISNKCKIISKPFQSTFNHNFKHVSTNINTFHRVSSKSQTNLIQISKTYQAITNNLKPN